MLREIGAEYSKVYGVDYVNLGYKANYQAVLLGMASNFSDIFPTDYHGTRLDEIPLTDDHRYLLLIPGFLGLLMFARFFPRIGWLTRIPLAFYIGSTAGITVIQQLHGFILPQVARTLLPLNPGFAVSLLWRRAQFPVAPHHSREYNYRLGES